MHTNKDQYSLNYIRTKTPLKNLVDKNVATGYY